VGRQTPEASFRLAITSAMSYHSRARSAYFRASSQVAVIFSGTDQACIMDRIGSLDIMTQMPKPTTTAADRRSTRGALQTCFKWMTRPRDSKELLELSQAQCTCDSGASLRLSHQVGLEFMDRSGPSLRKPFFVLA
jgi:queuine/archaeosine tRNA-ribosyltransferase